MPGGQVNIDALFPSFTGEESPREQTRVMLNYLRMLTERLRYQLDNLGKENFNAVALKQIQFETTEEIEGRLGELTKTVEEIQSVIDTLGTLAFKDSASGSYTPAGSVSKPTFTGTAATIKPKVTAAGTVSKPGITVTPTKETIYSITGVGSAPSLQTVVEGEDLRLVWSAGSTPTRSSKSVMTDAAAELDAAPTFTGTEVEGSASYTPAGSVSKPTFTGTQATITVS